MTALNTGQSVYANLFNSSSKTRAFHKAGRMKAFKKSQTATYFWLYNDSLSVLIGPLQASTALLWRNLRLYDRVWPRVFGMLFVIRPLGRGQRPCGLLLLYCFTIKQIVCGRQNVVLVYGTGSDKCNKSMTFYDVW